MKVLLFGISGLVGSSTAPFLLENFETVVAPVRRPYGNSISRIQTPVIDFERIATHHRDLFRGVDCLVYCLGTTLKTAGSVAEFRRIEWGLATAIATLAREAGVARFVLLSASGTNPESLIPYSKVKGEIERFVSELDFGQLVIAKPSLLVGDRAESRMIEGLSIKIARPLLKPLQKYLPKVAPIQDTQVARALVRAATMPLKRKITVLENRELLDLAGPPKLSIISV